jgi:hypothetical protein
MGRLKKFMDNEGKFFVKKLKPKKVRDLNPKTNRMKNFKRTDYVETKIPMDKRTYKNRPRYADGKPMVHFKDWLGIKGEKIQPDHSVDSYGKAEADGKYWGWSHRAIHDFGVGDKIKADTIGNTSGKEFTIKTDDQARDMAIAFAKEVS